MNEELRKELVDRVEIIMDELYVLMDQIQDNDEEKQRISMLVWGRPDFHVTNPEEYAKLAPYADENKPPFTNETVMLMMHTGGDPRLTYEQIERLKSGSNANQPWDDLVKES